MDASSARELRFKLDIVWAPVWKSHLIVFYLLHSGGRSKYYPGRIERDRGDGTYDVFYNDGEKETRVLEEYIKAEDGGSSDEERKRDDGSDRGRGRMRVGDKIEARYRGP